MVFAPSPGFEESDPDVEPQLIFTENETNTKKLYNQDNKSKYVKDAFHEYVVDGKQEVVNPENKEQKPLLGLHLKISQLGSMLLSVTNLPMTNQKLMNLSWTILSVNVKLRLMNFIGTLHHIQ